MPKAGVNGKVREASAEHGAGMLPAETLGSPGPGLLSRLPWRRGLASTVRISFLALMVAILYGPLAILVLFSFNNSIIIALPLRGFTVEWYREMLRDPNVIQALRNSLALAALVTPICLVLGTMAAYGMTRFRFRLRGLVAGLIGAALVVPWLVMGVSGLLFFNRLHIPLSLRTIAVMHVVVDFPLVAAIVSARLVRFDRSVEEAALDLGARPREVLRYILLPLLTPALAASAIIAFSWSFNNFTISFFTGGFQVTFPIWVYSSLNHAQNAPVINAIGTVVSVAEVLAVYVAWRLMRRGSSGGRAGALGSLVG